MKYLSLPVPFLPCSLCLSQGWQWPRCPIPLAGTRLDPRSWTECCHLLVALTSVAFSQSSWVPSHSGRGKGVERGAQRPHLWKVGTGAATMSLLDAGRHRSRECSRTSSKTVLGLGGVGTPEPKWDLWVPGKTGVVAAEMGAQSLSSRRISSPVPVSCRPNCDHRGCWGWEREGQDQAPL